MPTAVDHISEARAEWTKLDQAAKSEHVRVEGWINDQLGKFKADNEGRIPMPGDEIFAQIDNALKSRDALRQKADNARAALDQQVRVREVGAYSTEDVAGGMAREAAARFSQVISSRILQSQAYREAMALVASVDTDARLSELVNARGRVELGSMMSRDEFASIIDRGRGGFQATTITGGGATSAGPFVIPDYQSGFVPYVRKTPVMLSLVGPGATNSDTVDYNRQTAVSSGAAEVAEGSAAAESAIAFERVATSVQEVAHFVPVTRRALADASQLQTIVENDLLAGVVDRADTQVASGNGSGSNLTGIYNTSGIQTMALGGLTRADAVHRAMTLVQIAAGVLGEVDAVGMYPLDWQDLRLEKDGDGNYIFGPPSIPGPQSVWSKPVKASTVFTNGTPLTGMFADFSTAWIREAPSVYIGLNNDDFTKRQVSILAEMRLAFAVKRPTAFVTITGF